jgi:hypothetical protein
MKLQIMKRRIEERNFWYNFESLEMAAQKAVEQLVSKGLLDKPEIKHQIQR